MQRLDNRSKDELRAIKFLKDYQVNPISSILISFGATRVLCSVSIEDSVPRWRVEQGLPGGWLTAEYQMLPASTNERSRREVTSGKLSGRSAEIQRLIGRSLRAMVDLEKMPEKTFYIDCDVIDADGGTRCAAISGAALALELAINKLINDAVIVENPIKERIAAVSVGIVQNEVLLDLCYKEDSAAEVDLNLVMTASGRFVELQGSAEEASFDDKQLQEMLAIGKKGINEIIAEGNKLL